MPTDAELGAIQVEVSLSTRSSPDGQRESGGAGGYSGPGTPGASTGQAEDVVTPLPRVESRRGRAETGVSLASTGSFSGTSDAGESVGTADGTEGGQSPSGRLRRRKSLLKKVRLVANDSGKLIKRKKSVTQLRGAVKKITALRKQGAFGSLGDVAMRVSAQQSVQGASAAGKDAKEASSSSSSTPRSRSSGSP